MTSPKRPAKVAVQDKEEYRSELRDEPPPGVLPLPVGTSEKDITATYTAGDPRDAGAVRPDEGRGDQDCGHDQVAA